MLRQCGRLAHALGLGSALRSLIDKVAPVGPGDMLGSGSLLKRWHNALVSRARVWSARKEQNHWDVYRLYNQLMVNYTNAYRYHEAGDFYAGQMEMRRRENFENPLVRIGLWFYRLFSLFGERPGYAFGWLILVIALSGLVNLRIGITETTSGLVPMAIEETAVSSPAPESIVGRAGIIRYGSISPSDFMSPTFRDDYLRAVSATVGLFLPNAGQDAPVLADSPYRTFIIVAEMLLCILFFFLFATGVWRKFGRRAG